MWPIDRNLDKDEVVMSRDDATKECLLVMGTLNNDYQRTLSITKFPKQLEQCVYRLRINAAASLFEGGVNQFANLILIGKSAPKPITNEERLKLENKRINSDGNVRTVYMEADQRLLFVFRLYARVYSFHWDVDESSDQWKRIQGFLALRNRLVHPSCAADVQFTHIEMFHLEVAMKWFCQEANLLIQKYNENILNRRFFSGK